MILSLPSRNSPNEVVIGVTVYKMLCFLSQEVRVSAAKGFYTSILKKQIFEGFNFLFTKKCIKVNQSV